jgi:tetratricopeptide (TPR) repeat protein
MDFLEARFEMSRSPDPWRSVVLAMILAATWGGSVWVQAAVDHEIGPDRSSDEVLWISSGKVIHLLSMGQDALLADIYWTRVVQYYGARLRDHKSDFHLLAPLLNITATLDPQLKVVYTFGSIFLAEPSPWGPDDPQKAIDLLRRGITAMPDDWRLYHQLGFIYYWNLQDYGKAAAAYQEGAKNPHADDWMRVMAAAIHLKGGDRDTSLFLWQKIYDSTGDVTIRANALVHINGLHAVKDMEAIEQTARKFRDLNGRWPDSIEELVSTRLLARVPKDPDGYAYRILPGGKVGLDPKSTVRLDYDRAPAPPPKPAIPGS